MFVDIFSSKFLHRVSLLTLMVTQNESIKKENRATVVRGILASFNSARPFWCSIQLFDSKCESLLLNTRGAMLNQGVRFVGLICGCKSS